MWPLFLIDWDNWEPAPRAQRKTDARDPGTESVPPAPGEAEARANESVQNSDAKEDPDKA